jgi:hypothetical protein
MLSILNCVLINVADIYWSVSPRRFDRDVVIVRVDSVRLAIKTTRMGEVERVVEIAGVVERGRRVVVRVCGVGVFSQKRNQGFASEASEFDCLVGWKFIGRVDEF